MYSVKIISPNGNERQIPVLDKFIEGANVNLMKLFNAHNLDPNTLFNEGNTILFTETKNGSETILHTFKKWW